MHIITGLILTALLGKKAKHASESPLLRLKWPIETKHLLPGRVRFRIPVLIGDEAGTKHVKKQIQQIEGVNSVETNTISGSVLICYQPDKIAPELLFAGLIRLLGLEKELERTPQSTVSKEIRNIGEAMNRAVYSTTGGFIDLWTAVPLVLIVLGIRQMLAQRTISFPSGFTLVWWAYMMLFRERNSSSKTEG